MLKRAITKIGFDALNLDELYGGVMPEITASHRVHEKVGMRNLGMGGDNGFPIEVLVLSKAA